MNADLPDQSHINIPDLPAQIRLSLKISVDFRYLLHFLIRSLELFRVLQHLIPRRIAVHFENIPSQKIQLLAEPGIFPEIPLTFSVLSVCTAVFDALHQQFCIFSDIIH